MAAARLKVALVGGPMYDGLYGRLPEFERISGCTVDVGAHLIHPELNDHIAKAYREGTGDYDLIVTHNKYVPSQKQWLLPLDGRLGRDEISAFLPSAISLATVEGDLMGLPRSIDVRLLYYRRDLLEEHGNRRRFEDEYGRELGVPETWEQFGQAARFLSSPPDRYGTVFPGRYSGLFGTWYELMAMAGGRLLDDEDRPSFRSPEGEWALGFLRDLHTTWRTTPENLPDLYYDDVARYFCQGRAALVTDWPAGYHRYCDPATSAVADLFDVAIYPTGPAGMRRVYAGMFMFSIPRSVHDLAAALDLLRFLTNEESQAGEARQGALAVRPAVQRLVEEEAKPGSRDARRLAYLSETAEHSMLEVPKTSWYPLMEDTLWQAVQSGITGIRSVRGALETAERQVGRIMAQRP